MLSYCIQFGTELNAVQSLRASRDQRALAVHKAICNSQLILELGGYLHGRMEDHRKLIESLQGSQCCRSLVRGQVRLRGGSKPAETNDQLVAYRLWYSPQKRKFLYDS